MFDNVYLVQYFIINNGRYNIYLAIKCRGFGSTYLKYVYVKLLSGCKFRNCLQYEVRVKYIFFAKSKYNLFIHHTINLINFHSIKFDEVTVTISVTVTVCYSYLNYCIIRQHNFDVFKVNVNE